jgi:hypothetical protein
MQPGYLVQARWLDAPASDSIPRISNLLRTAHEYGLSAAWQTLKFRFREGPKALSRRAKLRFDKVNNAGQNTGQFRLTIRGAEAYIHLLGAPSAYGAIARL